jgi:ribosomal protein S7
MNPLLLCVSDHHQEEPMATAKKTARGRKQDRARVAGGQNYEVKYESKKTRRSASAVKKAVGNSRKRVEKRLGR